MAERIPANFRRVITAAAAGNVIEWYDFYIFGSLATILSVKFFEKSNPVAALLSTIALFTAGFLVPPSGAFVFRLAGRRGRPQVYLHHDACRHGSRHRGDRVDSDLRSDRLERRDHPVLFADGAGSSSGRVSYGGAITYVAEHVPEDRRGYYTGWLQTSPTLEIVLSLIVIIATRSYFGEAVFNDWAWRTPFLFSFLLVFVTMYMRANFERSRRSTRRSRPGGTEQESMARGLPQSRQSQVL